MGNELSHVKHVEVIERASVGDATVNEQSTVNDCTGVSTARKRWATTTDRLVPDVSASVHDVYIAVGREAGLKKKEMRGQRRERERERESDRSIHQIGQYTFQFDPS